MVGAVRHLQRLRPGGYRRHPRRVPLPMRRESRRFTGRNSSAVDTGNRGGAVGESTDHACPVLIFWWLFRRRPPFLEAVNAASRCGAKLPRLEPRDSRSGGWCPARLCAVGTSATRPRVSHSMVSNLPPTSRAYIPRGLRRRGSRRTAPDRRNRLRHFVTAR